MVSIWHERLQPGRCSVSSPRRDPTFADARHRRSDQGHHQDCMAPARHIRSRDFGRGQGEVFDAALMSSPSI
jgi:hypothetical protein